MYLPADSQACRYLLSDLAGVASRVRAAEALALFFDFDGTLAPIANSPSEVQLDPAVRDALAALRHDGSTLVGVLSGRALPDLRRRIALPGIVYVGNHGLEISGCGLEYLDPAAHESAPLLDELVFRLTRLIHRYPGVWIEHKRLSAAVHYRRAPARVSQHVEQEVRATVSVLRERFEVRPGKLVWEIMPRTGWQKGDAAEWIQRQIFRREGTCVYFGDDRSDESAFRRFPQGITVKVGPSGDTAARYFVRDAGGVHAFLRWLLSSNTFPTLALT